MGHQITINDKLYDDIKSYCILNKLKITAYCNEALQNVLIRSKFGDAPFLDNGGGIEVESGEPETTDRNPDYEESYKNVKEPDFSTTIFVNKDEFKQENHIIKSKKRKLA